MKDRRLGKFRITALLIDTAPEAVRLVMGCCQVVRAEFLQHEAAVEYVAYSPHFEPVPAGLIPPEYNWVMTAQEPLGQLTCRAIRIHP